MFDTIKLKFNKKDLDFVKRYANEENLDLDACCKKIVLDYLEDYYDYLLLADEKREPINESELTSLEDVKRELQDV